MAYDTDTKENIAQTLARELPKAALISEGAVELGGSIKQYAVPNSAKLVAVDDEKTLAAPRRAVAHAVLADDKSFLDYVRAHDSGCTDVWCQFDPVQSKLEFKAVFNEHKLNLPGWRDHTASFKPSLGVEWTTWKTADKKKQGQSDFATFLEDNEKDIAAGADGAFPSSLQMLQMATQFEANAERTFASKIVLQNGTTEMTFSDAENAETRAKMSVFSRFQLGIPVFWSVVAPGESMLCYGVPARLKYSVSQGKVSFWYELIRPDLVHERASVELIEKIRSELGFVPLRMGSCA